MKFIFFILFCLVLSTQQNCSNYPLLRVYKQNNSNYSLDNSNTWKDYPELKVSIQLGQSHLVQIGYTISIGSVGDSHLVTRLIVSQSQIPYFRVITGNTIYHTNTVSGYVALSEGKYDISVQYRTPGTFNSNSSDDWTVAQLQVVY